MTTTPTRERGTPGAVRDRTRRFPVWLGLLLALVLLAAALSWGIAELTDSDTPRTAAATGTAAGAGRGAGAAAGNAPAGATAAGPAALVGGGGLPAGPASGAEAAPGILGVVLFAQSSAEIDSAGQQVIQAAAQRLKALHASAVTVTGYTDVVSGQPINGPLSQQRADAVSAALTQLLGPGVQIATSAQAQADPVAPNTNPDGSDNPAGRAQNRRAVVQAR